MTARFPLSLFFFWSSTFVHPELWDDFMNEPVTTQTMPLLRQDVRSSFDATVITV